MTFRNLSSISDGVLAAFGTEISLVELPADDYATMRYPHFPAIMHFSFRRYAAEGFGHVAALDTRAMAGLMQLATIVFTPNAGTDAPLLLMDVMAMGKKRAAFVEYYDCTAQKAEAAALEAVAARYRAVADYPEKPAWYVGARAPYSLIKGGTDEAALLAMLGDTSKAYAGLCAARTQPKAENLPGLCAFVERMVREGNPSSATMEKVLGKDGAERFFREAVMPVKNPKISE